VADVIDLPKRKEVKQKLRELGLSNRQIDAVLRGGWAALVGASEAEADELRDKLAEMSSRFGSLN